MAARSIASLTLSFGLVSIPVRLYSATESAETVKFNMLGPGGKRVKQQYVLEGTTTVIARDQMVKGYEFEKDKFVLFTPDELKKLEEGSSHLIDIVAFIPEKSVDPLFYDKAYLLAPDKRGGKPYALLMEAMRASGRCALAKWAWKSKQYVVQIRPSEGGLVLQQLLYAQEVRSHKDLTIEQVDVSKAELQLALQLIEQNAEDNYDPSQFKDEERARILEAIDGKIAGKEIVASSRDETGTESGQVIDLMDALRASLAKTSATKLGLPSAATATSPGASATVKAPATAKASVNGDGARAGTSNVTELLDAKERKGVKRAPKTAAPVVAPAPAPAAATGTRGRTRK